MKLLSTIIFFFLTGAVFGQYVSVSKTEAIAKQELTRARMGKSGEAQLNTDSINITYHQIKWQIDPAVNAISGQITTHFTVNNGPISQIIFDKHANLSVDSVIYLGANVGYMSQNNQLFIGLPNALPSGSVASVTVVYHGTPPVNDGFYQRQHNGTPEIWTLSQPYGASNWWVCKNGLTDKVDSMDLEITVPLGNVAASHGVLTKVDTNGSEATYFWKHRYPVVPYLVSVAVTNYTLHQIPITSDGQTFPMMDYAYPEDSVIASYYLPEIVKQFRVFDSLFIPYPFRNEKYGHAQSKIGGGMEHQTISTMGFFSYDLMAHELAHQWFGDYVTCGTWSDLWLNEGFATYLTGLNREFNTDSASWMGWKTSKVGYVMSQPGGSIFVTDTLNEGRLFSSRLTYDKAAMVLHMLRFEVGDSAFFAGCKSYLKQPELANNFVRNSDLKHHMEQASGMNLTAFYDNWVFGEGYPGYNVVLAGEPNAYFVQLNQEQSHPSVSFFETKFELQVIGATRDTIITLTPSSTNDWLALEFDEEITALVLNPNSNHLVEALSYVLGTEQVANQLIKAYPNPANKRFTIAHNGDLVPQNIQVYNVLGKRVNVPVISEYKALHIQTETLINGVYFVYIKEEQRPIKFVVSHR